MTPGGNARCRGLLRAAVIVGVALALAASPAKASRRDVRTSRSGCGTDVERASKRAHGAPVLFVHGFAGAPSDFRRRLDDDRPTMLAAIRDLPGVVAYTFDYSAHSLEWVTDSHIGPELGRAIVCLASRHDAPVTVVAHSMGGLATREAQGGFVDGARVSDSLVQVVTIGTPFHGAQLLGLAEGTAGDIVSSVIRTALDACDIDRSRRPDRSVCGLLGATETAAVQGLLPGSSQLASLPRWAPNVRITPMAARIEVGIDAPFGFSEHFDIGDFAVSADSALADASRGARRFVAGCHASLLGLVGAIDTSPCSHANELANRRIVRQVRDRVRRAVARARVRTGT
jgi:triacylglycerol lipase